MTSKELSSQEMHELRCLAAKHVAYLIDRNCLLLAKSAIDLVVCATHVYSAITYLETAKKDLDCSPDDLWQEMQKMLDFYHELRTDELNSEENYE